MNRGGVTGNKELRTEVIRADDLIPDNRLPVDAPDLLEHRAIAKSVAEIALTADTPVNIALFGAWGSGKSSIFTMLHGHLTELTSGRVTVARYDAWKYGGKELKRNFVDSIAEDLGIEDPALREGLHRPIRKVELDFSRWFRDNASQLAAALLVAFIAAGAFAIGLALVVALTTDIKFQDALQQVLPIIGAVLGPAILAALLGPKVLEGVSVTTETPAPQEADQFAIRFRALITRARTSSHPLVVFIDELDRCAPDEVVATLRDLKTFLDEPNCAFIVAADRDVIVRALRLEVAQARPVREEEPYYATPGAYLDKIFQHQIALPPLRTKALTDFARDLAGAQLGGVWKEMREKGPDYYDRVIFALVPIHVRSPRRVKVLLNNFATNARVAQARGLGWLERAHEIAVLTVLQTEFPTVVHDLRRVPNLLTYLRGATPPAGEVERIVDEHIYLEAADPAFERSANSTQDGDNEKTDEDISDESTDDLIADTATPATEQRGASVTLRRQLHNYLRKIAAAGLSDPRPDLLYLRAAANRETLPEPALGDAIDYATDTDPSQVAALFSEQSSTTIAIAIPLLVTEGEGALGLGRRFAYEAACRLVEALDPVLLPQVASQISPALIAAMSAGDLSRESLPGALLVASTVSDDELVSQALDQLEEVDSGLLERLAAVAAPLEVASAMRVAQVCVEHLPEHAGPLLALLRNSTIGRAVDLWRESGPAVVACLNEAESTATGAVGAETPRQVERPSAEGGPSEISPSRTGAGISVLEALVELAIQRTDGEPLVSAIFASFQARPAASPFVQWTLRNADRVVGPMDSQARRARHALLGIGAFAASTWDQWGKHLVERGRTPFDGSHNLDTKLVRELASKIILERLLPTYAQMDEKLSIPQIGSLIRRASTWTDLDPNGVIESTETVLESIEWGATPIPWELKEAVYQTVTDLTGGGHEAGPADGLIAKDLAAVLQTWAIDEALVDGVTQLVAEFPPATVREVADLVGKHEPQSGEFAEMLRLRLLLEVYCDGPLIGLDELKALPESPGALLVDAWLAQPPPLDEVAQSFSVGAASPAALRAYARQLSVDDRTTLWVAGEVAGVPNGALAAIGAVGVAAAAVEHCRSVVAAQSQQVQRKAAVERLCSATPAKDSNHVIASVRRTAGALATDLLHQGVGEMRMAADLMVWAGGPSPKPDAALRALFDAQVEKFPRSMSGKTIDMLQDLDLLTRKRSFWKKLRS